MRDWFAANKTKIGVVFLAVYGAFVYVEPTAIPYHDTVKEVLDKLGMFLIGAGAIKSDQFHRDRAAERG